MNDKILSNKYKVNISQNNNNGEENGILNNKITRRRFAKYVGIISLIPLSYAWFSTTEKSIVTANKSEEVTLPADLQNGITFHDNFIVNKSDDEIDIFSSKCTHLGCKINKEENGKLLCPCHGSEYDLTGKVLRGPADKALNKLNYRIDKSGKIIVDVSA